MPVNWKLRGARLASVSLGLGAAYALHAALHLPPPFKWPEPPQSRVSVRAAPAPAAEPVAVVKTDAVLPLRTEQPVATPTKRKPKPAPAPTSQATSATAPEFVSAQTLPTIGQPALPAPRQAAADAQLPPRIGAEPVLASPQEGDSPAVPSEIPEFRSALAQFEEPGGRVLVLALLVNDQGVVVDSRIVVPSRLALNDISVTFTYLGKAWTDIDPPMVPGEYRWFELRIDQVLALERSAVLP